MAAGALTLVWLALSSMPLVAAIFAGTALLVARLLLVGPVLIGRTNEGDRAEAAHRTVQTVDGDELLGVHDERGGLLSPSYFELRLLEESLRCRRFGLPMVVLMIRSPSTDAKDSDTRRISTQAVAEVVNRSARADGVAGSVGFRGFSICLPNRERRNVAPFLRGLMGELGDEGWLVGMAVFPDDSCEGRDLLDLARRRLMPWRAPFWLAR